jgi:hypothetical protein
MALITHFEQHHMDRNILHEEIDAKYCVFEKDDAVFVQIDTFGTKHRANPGKKSQTIQLDRRGATELIAVLRAAFRL